MTDRHRADERRLHIGLDVSTESMQVCVVDADTRHTTQITPGG